MKGDNEPSLPTIPSKRTNGQPEAHFGLLSSECEISQSDENQSDLQNNLQLSRAVHHPPSCPQEAAASSSIVRHLTVSLLRLPSIFLRQPGMNIHRRD